MQDGVEGTAVANVVPKVCRVQHGGGRASDKSVLGHETLFPPSLRTCRMYVDEYPSGLFGNTEPAIHKAYSFGLVTGAFFLLFGVLNEAEQHGRISTSVLSSTLEN